MLFYSTTGSDTAKLFTQAYSASKIRLDSLIRTSSNSVKIVDMDLLCNPFGKWVDFWVLVLLRHKRCCKSFNSAPILMKLGLLDSASLFTLESMFRIIVILQRWELKAMSYCKRRFSE